jgi:hypothetical protein
MCLLVDGALCCLVDYCALFGLYISYNTILSVIAYGYLLGVVPVADG